MKRMLFNATQAEELRVAIVEGQKLVDLDIESAAKEQRKGNIYKAVVTRVEPSLEACFVDYGTDRHGFLPFKEIARSSLRGADNSEGGRGRVQDLIKEGQELVVQVEKDERGNKGAALTNFVSLAGRYLVLMPNNPRGGGVSRRIEGEERNELRDLLSSLEVPAGMSLIGRTAGIGRSQEELQWDLNYLLQLWSAIDNASQAQTGAFLIFAESSLVIRAIRDYFTPDIGELLIDNPAIFEQAHQFMAHVMPANVNKVKLYADPVPLFSRFQIEHQIETAYSREVPLPSGGAIVIDHTEALVAVDVNSAQATRGTDIEHTAFNTNLEAAEEVARQMRLRDLGGLIVIDFIDMESQKNQREVEDRLRESLKHDRARIQIGKISRFGLLELSRQRLQPSLGETSYTTCPRCSGTGHVRSTDSFALHLLRMLQEEAMKENTGAVHVQTPVEVATFLLNEKRTDILNIEARHKVEIVLIPNIHMEIPRYTLARLRHDQLNQGEGSAPSYKMVEKPAEEETEGKAPTKPERAQPVVQGITPSQPAPTPVAAPSAESTPAAAAKPGLFGRVLGWLRSLSEPTVETPPETKQPTEPRRESRDSRRGGRDGRDSNRRPRGDRNDRGERSERNDRNTERNSERNTERKERSNEPRGERPPRNDRQDRGERQERSDRPERSERAEQRPRRMPIPAQPPQIDAETDAEAVQDTAQIANAEPRSGEEREGRTNRRRGRGRRGNGERSEGRNESAAAVATQTMNEIIAEDESNESETNTAQSPEVVASTSMEPAALPKATPADVVAQTDAESDAQEAPVASEMSPTIELKAPATESSPEVASAVSIDTAPPVIAQPKPMPAADLASAGLELIETRREGETADTTTQHAPDDSASNPTAKRSRRRPRRPRDEASEPLMLVETKEDAVTTVGVSDAESESPESSAAKSPRRRQRTPVSTNETSEQLELVETRSE